jgi:hypothetical protein
MSPPLSRGIGKGFSWGVYYWNNDNKFLGRDNVRLGYVSVTHVRLGCVSGPPPSRRRRDTKWARQAVVEASRVPARQLLPMKRVREGSL